MFPVLLLHEGGLKYYKVAIDVEEGALSEDISKTCLKAGMKSVCNGPEPCRYNSGECAVTPASSKCGNGNLVDISKTISGVSDPGKCDKLDGVFGDSKGWPYPCGVKDCKYCFEFGKGKLLISGNPNVLYAFCVFSAS